jgi:hypothetical protein
LSTPSSAFRLAPAHALPTVSLTAPAAGATFGKPAQITISATATPTSGSSITKVEFYQDFFAQIGTNLASVAGQLGQLSGGSITGNHAELVVVRTTADGPTAFNIHAVRGADGIWRVESM